MTITQAMKLDNNSLRVTNGGRRWMVYHKEGWTVYERGYGMRTTTRIYQGKQETAVKFLLEE